MIFPWLVALLVSAAFSVASMLLRPKIKGPEPEAVRDLEGPTAEADRAIPWIFGSVDIDSPNCCFSGDKGTYTYEIRV